MKNLLPRQAVVVLGLVVLSALAEPAAGQIMPRRDYSGGYYGGWGDSFSAPYDPTATSNLMMSNAAQQQLAAQSQAAAQRAAVQSGIRSTVSNQATAWNQANVARRQDAQDFWWQTQQQQTAQRQQISRAAPVAAAPSFEPSTSTAAMLASPERTNDIIQWRPILYDRRFDALRAEVEAPYLRNGGNPLSKPTAADYRNMIKAFEQMKVVLKQMDSQISAREYLDTCQDLDGLIKQAGDRAERLEAVDKPKG